jgi:hypothetical protein
MQSLPTKPLVQPRCVTHDRLRCGCMQLHAGCYMPAAAGCVLPISTFRQKWTRLLPCSGIATCLAFRAVPPHNPQAWHAVPVLTFRHMVSVEAGFWSGVKIRNVLQPFDCASSASSCVSAPPCQHS